jgi:hypothetical protein
MARALSESLGWELGAGPIPPHSEAVFLSGYFESQILDEWPSVPVGAYFSHKEEEPKGNQKARLWEENARKVALRVATCCLYAEMLGPHGPTIQAAAPLERERFNLTPQPPSLRRKGGKLVVGFSGYTYPNKRKGQDLVQALLESPVGKTVDWRASGRGWPVPTKRYAWAEMPRFYQGLDLLVVPSRVEGIPMPPLEALACGVPVVIGRGVGLHDELPDLPGIYRYDVGNPKSLMRAFEAAVAGCRGVDREALRAATAPYSMQNWVRDIGLAFEGLVGATTVDAGLAEEPATSAAIAPEVPIREPVKQGTKSRRGIYVVAFGGPARESAVRLLKSIKRHMRDVPVLLCAAEPLGAGEDLFVRHEDADVGARRAKLKAYELTPAEWESVLYLDADTEVVAPIHQYFQWIEAGWEFVICKDPHLMDTMVSFERRNNASEMVDTAEAVHTLNTLQYNGGVWAFARNERVQRFFQRWQAEWEKHAQRDQGALVRAMYADPLRVLVLGNEWNTFPKYTRGITTAGLMHYPGDARRWRGLIPGRIDSEEAWRMAEEFEARRAATRR